LLSLLKLTEAELKKPKLALTGPGFNLSADRVWHV
jgi:hypothetical protein